MYPPLLRKQQDSVLLTDRRRLFPLTLPPRHRGRPLYPFLSPLPWDKEARTLQLLVPTVTVERPQLFAVSADTQIWTRQIPVSVNKSWCLPLECLHGPSSMSQKSTSRRQGSCLQPCQLISPGHAAYPSISTPAFFALVLYIWQSFPCNSPPSSKETMQRHLNQPQIPVAGERCSINKAVPTAMRTLLSSSAIKNSMRLSLNAESNPFTWRTQPVSVDLWRRSFYIPCDSKVWHGDEAVHC